MHGTFCVEWMFFSCLSGFSLASFHCPKTCTLDQLQGSKFSQSVNPWTIAVCLHVTLQWAGNSSWVSLCLRPKSAGIGPSWTLWSFGTSRSRKWTNFICMSTCTKELEAKPSGWMAAHSTALWQLVTWAQGTHKIHNTFCALHSLHHHVA